MPFRWPGFDVPVYATGFRDFDGATAGGSSRVFFIAPFSTFLCWILPTWPIAAWALCPRAKISANDPFFGGAFGGAGAGAGAGRLASPGFDVFGVELTLLAGVLPGRELPVYGR